MCIRDSLCPEALGEVAVLAQSAVQELDRDSSVEDGVGGRPDLTHAADGDAPGQGVAATQDGALGGVHRFNTAWMTVRAIGAATLPPKASLPAFPPSSTTTATAMVGWSAGAKATNQACGA